MSGRWCKMILFVLFFLGLSTLRPAHAIAPALPALLNPAVLGAVVVAGGVIAGAAAHYAPAVYEAGQVACSSAGTFTRTLYQTEKFVLSSGVQYVAGRLENTAITLGDMGSPVYDWVANHAAAIPGIFNILQTSISPDTTGHPAVNDVFDGSLVGFSGLYKITSVVNGGYTTEHGVTDYEAWAASKTQVLGFPFIERGSGWIKLAYAKTTYNSVNHFWNYKGKICYYASTTNSPTVLPSRPYDKGIFAVGIAGALADPGQAPAIASEVDSIITANPGAVTGVPPWSQADNDEAWRLVHSQSDDSRYSTVPPDNSHGKPACADIQGR